MASKYAKWIHKVSNGRFIVAEQKEDGRWYSKNGQFAAGVDEVIGVSPLDLVAKKIRTYANWNAAVKAFRRVYKAEIPDLPENEIKRGPRT